MWFVVYRIWSTNWFQDKENEIKKFLQFLIQKNYISSTKKWNYEVLNYLKK
jgi:hypothetical protein